MAGSPAFAADELELLGVDRELLVTVHASLEPGTLVHTSGDITPHPVG